MLSAESKQLSTALSNLKLKAVPAEGMAGFLAVDDGFSDEAEELGCRLTFGLHSRFPHVELLMGMSLTPLAADQSELAEPVNAWNLRGTGPKAGLMTSSNSTSVLLQQSQLLPNEENEDHPLSQVFLEDCILQFCKACEEFLDAHDELLH